MTGKKHEDVLRIDGRFYDTQALARIHPGGELAVQLWNCKDATAIYNSSHRRPFPHAKYAQYEVAPASVAKDSVPEPHTQSFKLYFEICERIKPVLKGNGFAPWYYFIKVFVILAVVFYFDAICFARKREMWETVLQSLFCGFIGLNIQHDANHGAVSKSGLVNRILGMSQDYIGGSSLGWMISHNTVHHVHCNDIERDGDLNIPLLRLHKNVQWHIPHVVQQLYFIALEAFFGPVHVLYNLITTWSGPKGPQRAFAHHWELQKIVSLVPFLRFFFLMQTMNFNEALLHTAVNYAAGGMYLAFFFIISHNFDGVKKEGIDSTAGCFVRNQAETSSNVGGWLLAQMNGGLNYQIEHHLFPRVHHSFYPYIAPIVRRVCEEHGIKYTHYPTIFHNIAATYRHMRDYGRKPE